MTFILAIAILLGPLPEAKPSLQLRIHVGAGRESDIIRSELARDHLWFAGRRAVIEQRYRIVLVDDGYRSRPWFQIGKADERREFASGAFASSGSFMLTIKSLTDIDQWERAFAEMYYVSEAGTVLRRPPRPWEFPVPWDDED